MSYRFLLARFTRTASIIDLRPGAHLRAIRSRALSYSIRHGMRGKAVFA